MLRVSGRPIDGCSSTLSFPRPVSSHFHPRRYAVPESVVRAALLSRLHLRLGIFPRIHGQLALDYASIRVLPKLRSIPGTLMGEGEGGADRGGGN